MSYVTRRSWKSKTSGRGHVVRSGNPLRKLIVLVLMLFLIFEVVSSLFITSYRIASISMEPTVPSEALVLASPLIFGPELPFAGTSVPGIRKPGRGELVICAPAYYLKPPWYVITLDAIIRFFTLQKIGFTTAEDNWSRSLMLKRVIGIPGDTVMMQDMEIFIKPEGRNNFFRESEIMQIAYTTEKYPIPENMPEEFPLSGNMKEISLGDNEYFLSGDNRAMSNDSYYWGPVSVRKIKAKALIQYVPEIKFLQ